MPLKSGHAVLGEERTAPTKQELGGVLLGGGDELRELEAASLAEAAAASSCQEAQHIAFDLLQQVDELDRRCQDVEWLLQERKSVHSNARLRWEGEEAAWQTLCADAEEASAAACARRAASEARRAAAELQVRDLRASLQDTENEVARLHSVQSALEAKRLQTAEGAREAMAEFRSSGEEDAEPPQAPGARDMLLQDLAAAKLRAEMVRLECIEARELCRQAVTRLSVRQRCPAPS
mmetsp:Transcript_66092/g.119011  ORF Transcript_66092/g.119011 Transcript_66092/m.119011 type:complete len:236 (+) Transcript_66092:129-836(+)